MTDILLSVISLLLTCIFGFGFWFLKDVGRIIREIDDKLDNFILEYGTRLTKLETIYKVRRNDPVKDYAP